MIIAKNDHLYILSEKPIPIDTAYKVMDSLLHANTVLLGGDILDSNGNYTYGNWYYEYNPVVSEQENCKCSIEKARKYLLSYIEKNGVQYTVVLVLRDTRGQETVPGHR